MKLRALLVYSSVLLFLGLLASRSDDAAKSATASDRVPYDYLLGEVNSLSRILYELASERYAANSNRGETWILTVHEGRPLRKYTDKKYTVVSLPVVQPSDRTALCRYAAQYNVLNVQAADRMVNAGKHQEARELYRLVLHFDRCGDDLLKERTEKKLVILDRLEKGESVEDNLKEFNGLCDELGTLIDFSQISKAAPTVVTNLFKVRLP